jgi:hypothetical protein
LGAFFASLDEQCQRGDLVHYKEFSAVQRQNPELSKADVAQLVEQPIRNRQVIGSSPIVGSSLSITYAFLHYTRYSQ